MLSFSRNWIALSFSVTLANCCSSNTAICKPSNPKCKLKIHSISRKSSFEFKQNPRKSLRRWKVNNLKGETKKEVSEREREREGPFGSGVGASVGVEVIEDARDGFVETEGSSLHRVQVQLLLHRLVQPLHLLYLLLLLLLLLVLVLVLLTLLLWWWLNLVLYYYSLHGWTQQHRERERESSEVFESGTDKQRFCLCCFCFWVLGMEELGKNNHLRLFSHM